MEAGAFGRTATLANAFSEAGRFGLTPDRATVIVDEVESTIAEYWRAEFRDCGIHPARWIGWREPRSCRLRHCAVTNSKPVGQTNSHRETFP